MQTTPNFEELIELSKRSLDSLSNQNLPLKESLEIYKQGLSYLKEAQRLLEEAKLEYQEISKPQE
ncbi:exodeoxyribonuclease VII small subunit [uncultured Helicobacter sp.]|uniref:exodeoxyribonuclease VII small subunit n=1 Tax=uncultured Helicobacter sp. TaxID=175537 RepID=UPI001F94D6C2|nr:exodeoxyribonuclease VII small subunit [uncultured Helicobacter sp.]HIY44181.1 exodeoxyribonuclease VII small subunit [Candidatus Helicobacter avistercoris]